MTRVDGAPADASAGAIADQIERAEIDALFGTMVTLRLVLAPVVALVGLALVLLDPDPWRWRTAIVTGAVIVAIGVFEYARWRAGRSGRGAVAANLLIMGAFQLTVSALTGGLQSPIIMVVLPISLLSALLVGPRPFLVAIYATLELGLALLAWGPVLGWLPDLRLDVLGGLEPGSAQLTATWLGLSFVTTGALGVGMRLRRLFESMVRRALAAREGERLAHEAHARELVTLSAEIAHELKNPLASVKGLAALLARDVDGKPGERLGVLRGEVDRMQEILSEFLDFSRPIVPLTQEPVPLRSLAEEVAALQEGLSRARGVRIEVVGEETVARCDRRKVRQVLVNLVQNAVEASPTGGTVTVRVRGEPVAIDVADEGTGWPADVRDRLFEAGVTTKAQGSGLGLTIARALARQHGGELTLGDGSPGAIATLTLPGSSAG